MKLFPLKRPIIVTTYRHDDSGYQVKVRAIAADIETETADTVVVLAYTGFIAEPGELVNRVNVR